jgi:hypothetical protein
MKYEGLILAGGAVVSLFLVRSILKGTGLIPNQAPPLTWDVNKVPLVNSTTCKSSYTSDQIRKGIFSQWAKQIKDAAGIFNDDEAAIYDVLMNKIRTRGDLYLLGQYFSLQYQQNLIQFLTGILSAEEMEPITKRINKLPCNI